MFDPAHYALRRTLPPWRFEETLRELLEKIPVYGINEIIVKIDTEEFSHGHPSLEWAAAYQSQLFRLKAELEARGVLYSLNPWITTGHCDRGRNDLERLPGLETVVGHDGVQCRHCACPLSAVWRDHLTKLWTIYAEPKPHVMWIEDDIRSFNHEPVRFGCFCASHMERFSRLVGRTVTRRELVTAMLQPGAVHPWRGIYLRMQQDIINETAGFLGRLMHRISPGSALGLMSSGPRQHCLENRDWEAMARNLADGGPLYSRPPMCNYFEESLRGLYYSHDSIKLTREVLPSGTIEQTEIENVPFTRFSKSVTFTFIEMALSFAYGSHGVTLNLYDHVGTPLEAEEAFGRMLGAKKAYLNALAEATQAPGEFLGVRLLHHPHSSLVKELAPDADYSALAEDGFKLMEALEGHGIATVYGLSGITAAAGQTLRAFSDEELLALLRQGLFLDASAAGVLVERGFGRYIGVREFEPPRSRPELDVVLSAEEFHHRDFGGAPGQYLTATLPWLNTEAKFSRIVPAPGAEVISTFVGPDTEPVMTGMFAYGNELGGRVIVHALEYETAVGVSFFHPFRRRQLHQAMRFLGGGRAPLLFDCDGAYALTWRRECEGHTLVGVFNLNLDDWTRCQFQMSWDKPLPRLETLGEDGFWSAEPAEMKCEDQQLTVTMHRVVNHRLPLVMKLIS